MKIQRKFLSKAPSWVKRLATGASLLVVAVSLVPLAVTLKAHADVGGIFAVSISPVNASVAAGDLVQYKIDYSCSANGVTGANTCNNVTLEVPHPVNTTTRGTITGTSQTTSNTYDSSTLAGKWTFTPSIPAGSSGTLYVSWNTQNYTVPNGTSVSATVRAYSDGVQFTSSSASATVTATPDWRIVKTPAATTSIPLGINYTYKINMPYDNSATNTGRLNLSNVTIVDTLPAGAEYVSSTLGGVYDSATNTVRWNNLTPQSPQAADLLYNMDVAVTVKYNSPTFTSGQTVTNNVRFEGTPLGTTDTHTNSTSVTNTLASSPTLDMTMQKSHLPTTVAAGSEAEWRLRFYNESTLAVDVSITDNNPCLDGGGGVYESPAAPVISCNEYAWSWLDRVVFFVDPGTQGAVKSISWVSETGKTGTYVVPVGTTNYYSFEPSSLGVPAGEEVASYTFNVRAKPGKDVSIRTKSGANDGFSTTLQTGDTITNRAQVTYTDGYSSKSGQVDATVTIREPLPSPNIRIADAAGSGVAYQPSRIIDWNVDIYGPRPNEGIPSSPDVYIAIPKGLRYIPGSIEYIDLSEIGGVKPELVESYAGTANLENYTILHLKWPQSATMPATSPGVTFKIQTMVEPSQPPATYSGRPPYAGQPAATDSRAILTQVYANGYDTMNHLFDDYFDFDKDGDPNEKTTYGSAASWTVNQAAVAFGDITVQGSLDTTHSMTGTVVPGGVAQYKIDLVNASNDGSTLRDFVFYQTLPRVGDTYVAQGSGADSRGSQYNVSLTGPVVAPAQVQVQYSVSDNPCRDEVYPNANNPGCVDDWTTTITDWSTVKAIKYTMSGSYGPGQGESVTLPVVAPLTASDGQSAYTSMAYRATSSTGTVLLPAEAPKVALTIKSSTITVEKSSNPASGSQVLPNQQLTYTVQAVNDGSVDISSATIDDNFAQVLSYANFVPGSITTLSSVTGNTPPSAQYLNGHVVWNGAMKSGERITLTYKVRVKADAENATIRNVVTSSGKLSTSADVKSNCMTGIESGCSTANTVPSLSLLGNKTVSPFTSTEVPAGTELTYSLVVKNTGGATVDAIAEDDLTSTLAAADLVAGSLVATSSVSGNTPATPVVNGNTLTWSGKVESNEVVTLRYRVIVRSGVYSQILRNGFILKGSVNGGGIFTSNCETGKENGCNTANITTAPRYNLAAAKESSPITSSQVNQGDEITYTLHLKNQSDVPVPAKLEDDLTEVLKYNDIVSGSITVISSLGENHSLPAVALNRLDWAGNLKKDEEITITYKVKVKADAYDVRFRNGFVASATAQELQIDGTTKTVEIESPCIDGIEMNCFTEHSTDPALTKLDAQITQSSSKTLSEGDTVEYTITVKNSSEVPLSDVALTNDVSELLRNGTIDISSITAKASDGSIVAKPEIKGGLLVWGGDMAVGSVVTIGYQLKLSQVSMTSKLQSSITSFGTNHVNGEVLSNCVNGSEDSCDVVIIVQKTADSLADTGKSMWVVLSITVLSLIAGVVAILYRKRSVAFKG